VLHRTISALRAATWEQINQTLLISARATKLERGQVVRLDSTVTAALVPPLFRNRGQRVKHKTEMIS
jgi:IS5 family transposase